MHLAALALLLLAADPVPRRPVHTYSIVARDATTGELGVAVQSHWFSVGSRVAWAEAGVGAIATQSFTDPAYGALGLAMMRLGKSAPDALQALVAGDAGRDVRQLGFVDASGRASTYTGAKCIPAAGGRSGDGYAVQANLMEKDTVWPAMAKAYESASGDLAERMLQALEAAEREGGDLRGRQSAALVIVKAKSSGRPWADRVFDLRVDDHAQPLVELRRLVEVQRAYNHMNVGDECAELQDWTCADREYGAAQKLQPANAEISFWAAVGQAMAGRMETATPLFRRAFVADARWRELVKRLPGVGLLPNDPKLLEQILIIK